MSDSRLRLQPGLDPDDCLALGTLMSQIVGGGFSKNASIISPAMLLGRVELAALTAELLPPPGMGVVHESQTFRQNHAPDPGRGLDIAVSSIERASGRVFDVSLFEEDSRTAQMQTRLRFVTPEEMRGLKGADFPERMAPPETAWMETSPIGEVEVGRYLTLSHDPNPIHRDNVAARSVGLSGAVVPGMMFCGLAEAALHRVFPKAGVTEMKTRFMCAVPVGQMVRLGVVPRKRDDSGHLTMARIFVLSEARVIAAVVDVTCKT